MGTWERIPPVAAEMWVFESQRPEMAAGFASFSPADKDLRTEACCSRSSMDFGDASV